MIPQFLDALDKPLERITPMTEWFSPALSLKAYASGLFPMADSRDSPDVSWFDPERRGIFPLDGFHISRSLAREIRREDFTIRTDSAFEAVIDGCASRPNTWINGAIRDLHNLLHMLGHAHSLEVWADGNLIGGVYGITLGGAFFGESMFSRRRNASKIALAYLVHRLKVSDFSLFDTQFLTDHLASLGAVEISRAEYHARLKEAVRRSADFNRPGNIPAGREVLQRNTQTS